MDMPISERRLNIKFINEHLDVVRAAKEQSQTVTANKPLIQKPGIQNRDGNMPPQPTYTSKAKSKK